MSAPTQCFVSVVAPVYNVADALQEFIHVAVHTLQRHYSDYELILVEDGSTDASMAVVSEALADYACVRVLRMPRRFGEDVAIAAGLESAIGDYVVVMLPDADPPERIPDAVALAMGGADVVVGIQREASASPIVRLREGLFRAYCRRICRIDLPRNQTKLRALSRRVVTTLLQLRDQARFLRFASLTLGYRLAYFEYAPLRPHDRHDRSLGDSLRLMLDLAVANSRHPLRLATWAGGLASVLSALYSVYIVAVYLLRDHTAEGWTTLSLQISLLFCCLFLILMVACEYLGQILFESRERPLYYLLEERNSSVMLADRTRRNLASGNDFPGVPPAP